MTDSGCAAFAQVTPDGTLSTTVDQTGNNFAINDGDRVGNNLFHSFSQFSVPTGGSARFNNAVDIQNIFSRVTGGSVSNIDGLIQANGTANLFLINPSGILFGPNASLNLGGSFVGTTANSIQFADRAEFSAVNVTGTPVLTLSVPIGLQMGQTPSAIINQSRVNGGRGLEVDPGRNLFLVGGDVIFQGGRIRAPGGQVELTGIAGAGTVNLDTESAAWRLTVPSTLPLANLDFSAGAGVYVRAQGGGGIVLRGQNVSLTQNSFLRAGIDPGGSDRSARAGDVRIEAPGSFTLSDSLILNTVTDLSPDVTGTSGDVTIKTGTFSLLNGGQLSLGTARLGDGGNANIEARTVEISGISSIRSGASSGIFNRVFASGIGQTGNIDVVADSIALTAGGQISANVFGEGRVGNVNLTARQITLDGGVGTLSSAVFNTVSAQGQGQSGDINITTDSLRLTNSGQIVVDLRGQGQAGNVNIRTQALEIDGGRQVALSETDTTFFLTSIRAAIDRNSLATGGALRVDNNRASGQGGNLNIISDSVVLSNGGGLETSTDADGNAGNITLTAKTILMDGAFGKNGQSGAFSDVLKGGVGQGGTIQLNTDTLTLRNGAQVASVTRGQGNAGNIQVNAATEIRLTGSNPFNSQDGSSFNASSFSSGQGGSVDISTSRLILENGAEAIVSAFSTGNAGTLSVNANSVTLTGRAGLRSESFTTGDAGNVTIQATEGVTLQSGAEISSRSFGTGLGGTVDIAARSLFIGQSSQINASTVGSDGGNVRLAISETLLLRELSLINAEAGGTGNGGNITLNAPFITGLGNSDIIANAVQGRGGTIKISTDGIFGLKFRNQRTPNNDITANSQFGLSGTVQINLLSVNPANSLDQLAIDLVDPSQQIAQGCAANQGSSFVITGRGGLPSNPMQQMSSDRPWSDTRNLAPYRSSSITAPPHPAIPAALVEATGWRRNAQGLIELHAETPSTTLPLATPVTCAGAGPFTATGAIATP